mgnify:CR=1 FL=1
MKLKRVRLSSLKGKKYVAVFEKDGKEYSRQFGQRGANDYTRTASPAQREAYRARHASGKDAAADTPNALAYHLLWGDSRDISKNIVAFKKKYSL